MVDNFANKLSEELVLGLAWTNPLPNDSNDNNAQTTISEGGFLFVFDI